MASANLDLVRSIYAAWERGDFFSGPSEWVHPEIEFVVPDGPEPGSWTGLAGLLEGARAILNAWENWRPKADEYRELDDERVLGSIRRLSKHPHITRTPPPRVLIGPDVEPPPESFPGKVARWRKEIAPFHDRFFLWEGGSASPGRGASARSRGSSRRGSSPTSSLASSSNLRESARSRRRDTPPAMSENLDLVRSIAEGKKPPLDTKPDMRKDAAI
jgi:hypothetical protein